MLCIPVLWPTLSCNSYVRWRTPALAFMRLALVAMPFQFSTRVFNALAPGVATGHFAALLNLYTLLNGGGFSCSLRPDLLGDQAPCLPCLPDAGLPRCWGCAAPALNPMQ